MLRRTRSSTLFPTRRSSDLPSQHNPDVVLAVERKVMTDDSAALGAKREVFSRAIVLNQARRNTVGFDNRTEDRKSTRLNSSHLGISYAVFCLKKKQDKHYET